MTFDSDSRKILAELEDDARAITRMLDGPGKWCLPMNLLNSGTGFAFEGKTYRVRDLTEGEKELYSGWLRGRAKADAARSSEDSDLPEAFVRLQVSTVTADIAAGLYDWGSENCLNALTRTRSGGAYALYLMLKDEHPEIDELAARRMYDAQAAELARLIAEGALDPPASAAPEEPSPPGPHSTPGSPTNPESSDPGKSPG